MPTFDFSKPGFEWARFVGRPYHRYLPDKKNMAYNKFTLEEAVERFGLSITYTKSVADTYHPHPPSDLLRQQLRRGTSQALKINTEKARSEFIIAPVLLEIWEIKKENISLFSGIEFRVDAKRGLNGRCDFLVSMGKQTGYLGQPVLTIIEAKKSDLETGTGQCVAEMVAAQLFNERRGKPIRTIYGAVTTGLNWLFLKLEGQTVFIEDIERVYDFERNLDELIGLLLRLTEPQD